MTVLTGGAKGPTTTDDYTRLCEGVRAIAKVDLLQYKRGQMERRVRSFAERRGHKDLDAYLQVMKRDRSEVDAFLDRVTINVSQLWRNPEQWDVLAKQVLPELAKSGRVRIWSAGCSYGAEAYTLAAVCRATIPGAKVEIRGTDIDPRMVERAQAGSFNADDGRDAPKAELRRWFDLQADGTWQAKRELRAMTRFEVGDLLRLRTRAEAYDLVLCRNTVIYFTEEVRDDLHARLVASVRPGGYFVIGATERVAHARELGLSPTQPFTYRKS
jgi:chemotaxis protein methyltransferase CheR